MIAAHQPFRVRRLALALAPALVVGCATAPHAQLEESRGQIVALRAELAQAKDVGAKLRTQNRDISARAVEDSRRLAILEETNERLGRSVAAYQKERDEYAAALDQINREVASAASEAVRRK
jgi:chromosome segregation ATPase